MPLTWLITGCSSGLGLALARCILEQGHNVIATSRNPGKTPDLVEEITSRQSGRWLMLDVSSPKAEIERIVQQAWTEFGAIDVFVNNAGYSILGVAEEIPEEEAKKQFEVNFWGLIRTTQAILPMMRSRKSGTIINISSIAGIDPLPLCSIYAASKFAVEAWSEALHKELQPLGLRVLIVEPGMFRTNFLSNEASPLVTPSAAYKTGSLQTMFDKFQAAHGTQSGDPAKAAKRIFEVVVGTGMGLGIKSVLRLVLGPDAFSRAVDNIKSRQENLDTVKTIAYSTNLGG